MKIHNSNLVALVGMLAVSQLRICRPPPPVRSGHLNIKYAQCAENKDGRKISYNITSRLGTMGFQKGRFG